MEIAREYKMHMESKRRSTLVLALTISGISLLICLIVAGLSTPNMTKTKIFFSESCSLSKSQTCFDSIDNYTIQFVIKDIKKKNHFLYYEFVPYFNSRELKLFMAYNLTATSDDKSYKKIKHEKKSYTLKDSEAEVLAYVPYTIYDTYHLNVTFNTTSSVLSAFRLKVTYMEIDYFNFLIAVKYFFFSLTVMFMIWFMINSCAVPVKKWYFETYSTMIMGFSLLIYNEPLIGAYTEIFEKGYLGISVFCNTQFLCLVLLYFLFLMQKTVINWKARFFYLIELVAVLIIFAFYFAIYMYVEESMRYDEKFDYHDIKNDYLPLFKAFIAFLVLIACAILVFMIMAIKSWITRDIRYVMYWIFNYCIIVLTFVFVGMGYFRLMIGGQALLGVIAMYNISFYLLLWLCAPDKNDYLYESNSEAKDNASSEYRFEAIDNQA